MHYGVEEAIAVMGRDYLLLAFLVNLGVLQVAVTLSGAQGLWILPWKLATRLLGTALIVAGVAVFVLSPLWVEGPWAAGSVVNGTSEGREWGTATLSEVANARTLNDIHGGLDGNDYASRFPLAALLAFVVSAIIGGVNFIVRRPAESTDPSVDGLESVAGNHYLSGLAGSFALMKGTIRSDFARLMSDSPRWSIPKLIERRLRRESA